VAEESGFLAGETTKQLRPRALVQNGAESQGEFIHVRQWRREGVGSGFALGLVFEDKLDVGWDLRTDRDGIEQNLRVDHRAAS